jgi:hypothetical protein
MKVFPRTLSRNLNLYHSPNEEVFLKNCFFSVDLISSLEFITLVPIILNDYNFDERVSVVSAAIPPGNKCFALIIVRSVRIYRRA